MQLISHSVLHNFLCLATREYEELNNENSTHSAKNKKEVSSSASMLLNRQMKISASSNVAESAKLLSCCRSFPKILTPPISHPCFISIHFILEFNVVYFLVFTLTGSF